LQRSNDNAACGHDSKFKPLVLGEIQAADDRRLRDIVNPAPANVVKLQTARP
jgi:hypothetical protein